jgi:hypothetical protein
LSSDPFKRHDPFKGSALCPVCGYQLDFYPWIGDSASHEICPCCFIEFGYDDGGAYGELRDKHEVWKEWRDRWIGEGMKWHSRSRKPPENWNPIEQLKKAKFLE